MSICVQVFVWMWFFFECISRIRLIGLHFETGNSVKNLSPNNLPCPPSNPVLYTWGVHMLPFFKHTHRSPSVLVFPFLLFKYLPLLFCSSLSSFFLLYSSIKLQKKAEHEPHRGKTIRKQYSFSGDYPVLGSGSSLCWGLRPMEQRGEKDRQLVLPSETPPALLKTTITPSKAHPQKRRGWR